MPKSKCHNLSFLIQRHRDAKTGSTFSIWQPLGIHFPEERVFKVPDAFLPDGADASHRATRKYPGRVAPGPWISPSTMQKPALLQKYVENLLQKRIVSPPEIPALSGPKMTMQGFAGACFKSHTAPRKTPGPHSPRQTRLLCPHAPKPRVLSPTAKPCMQTHSNYYLMLSPAMLVPFFGIPQDAFSGSGGRRWNHGMVRSVLLKTEQ